MIHASFSLTKLGLFKGRDWVFLFPVPEAKWTLD